MSKINTCNNKIIRVANRHPAATLRQTARNVVFFIKNLPSHVFFKNSLKNIELDFVP